MIETLDGINKVEFAQIIRRTHDVKLSECQILERALFEKKALFNIGRSELHVRIETGKERITVIIKVEVQGIHLCNVKPSSLCIYQIVVADIDTGPFV
jgi:hypothetical protein